MLRPGVRFPVSNPAGAAHVDDAYKLVDIVGTSQTSSDDAIRNAIAAAAKTLRRVDWFEVVETRGHVADGKVCAFPGDAEGGDFGWSSDGMSVDVVFSGGIPEAYDTLMVPLIFEPDDVDLARAASRRSRPRACSRPLRTGAVTRALACALPPEVDLVATDLNGPYV